MSFVPYDGASIVTPRSRIRSRPTLGGSLLAALNRCMRPLGLELGRYPAPTTFDWHLKTLLEYEQIECVLDVGANHGQFAERLRRLGYRGWIVSFEPIPRVFAELRRRFANDDRWRGFELALGDRDETKPFHIARGDAQASSFLTFNDAGPARWGDDHTIEDTVSLEVRRLDNVWDECLSGVDASRALLKMDCQGYDLNVVAGAKGRMGHIVAIQSELALEHFYEDMTSFNDAVDAYEQLGYDPVGFFPLARRKPDHLRMVEMDCLFLRNPDHVSQRIPKSASPRT